MDCIFIFNGLIYFELEYPIDYYFTTCINILNSSKLAELEEELNVVATNMKMLEISEQEALTREESYVEQIKQTEINLTEVFLFFFSYQNK